jgi:toxin secretion/phage lysis holin
LNSEEVVGHIVNWSNEHKLEATLIALMLIDIVMGLLVAFGAKTVSSTISSIGMAKKAAIILMVGVGYLLQAHIPNIPSGPVIAMFFLVTEAISITESAAVLGIPMPPGLVAALGKLQGKSKPPFTIAIQNTADQTFSTDQKDASQQDKRK